MRSHLHFMGIGGISMSGLARHMRAEGHRVSGCDAGESTMLDELQAQGIEVMRGHSPAHVDGIDTLVTSMAIPESHGEPAAARRAGVRTVRRIELLGELFDRYDSVGVTGSHGKSTTTAMIATAFMAADRDPAVQLGATLPLIGGNMRYGRGPLIAEVDESDPGFAELRAKVAVITNLEDDHVAGSYSERRNYHASLADLEAATRRFAAAAGTVVACADWPGLDPLLHGLAGVRSYGTATRADYRISGLLLEEAGSRFRLTAPAGAAVDVELVVPGVHNALNAAGALAAADVAGIPLTVAAAALRSFEGVGRRWQRWGTVGGALIIDDYAHHPTEVEATLRAARNTGRRVRAVLQPHRWVRTARHWPALADAAALADEVIVLDVYAAGESAIPGVSSRLIVDRLRQGGTVASHHDLASASDYLLSSLRQDDLVITLGAGDVWRVAASLARSGEVAGACP